ncbi:hypothetical protein COOONC_03634 [Cooperia oncophora]
MYDNLKNLKRSAEDLKRDAEQDYEHDEHDEHDDLTADEDRGETTTQKPPMPPPRDDDHDFVMPPYDEETKKAMEEAEAARKEYDEVDIKVSTLESQIREAESFTEQDFGSDHAWAALKGQNWKDWTGEPPHKYSKQSYSGGQQCWNGPQRSTEVEIQCGETSELIEATEPAKCEYRFVFRTPAACNDPDHEEPQHMEL